MSQMIDLKKKRNVPVRSWRYVGPVYPNQRSWNAKKTSMSYDLDLSAFMLGADGKLVSDDFSCSITIPTHPTGAVFWQK